MWGIPNYLCVVSLIILIVFWVVVLFKNEWTNNWLCPVLSIVIVILWVWVDWRIISIKPRADWTLYHNDVSKAWSESSLTGSPSILWGRTGIRVRCSLLSVLSWELCHTMHMCTHALSLLIGCCIVSSFKHAQMTSGNITIFATSSTYCDPSRLLLLSHGILQYLAVTYGNQSSWKSPQSWTCCVQDYFTAHKCNCGVKPLHDSN